MDISKNSNADVTQRESLLKITQARLSPDRQQVLYTYQTLDRAQFNHTYRPVAERLRQSGLWLYDHRTQTHRELQKSDNSYTSLQRIQSSTWWGNQEMLYLDSEARRLQRRNLQTGEDRPLFEGHVIHDFQVKAGYAFVLYYDEALKRQRLTRIQKERDERLTVDIPYQDFYSHPEGLQAVSEDIVLLGQSKAEYQRENYPFKVATTSPPPIQDTFLIKLSSAEVTPLEKGLDLSRYEQIEMSADQQYLASQHQNNSQIHTSTGELLWESEGRFAWLSAQDILIQNRRELSLVRVSEGKAQLQARHTTQTECTTIQGANPVLMTCPLGETEYSNKRLTRIFRFDTMQELSALTPATGDSDTLTRSQTLLPEETEQPVRMVEQVAEQKGYTSLSYLDETGAITPLFRLSFPEANFVFEGSDTDWLEVYD